MGLLSDYLPDFLPADPNQNSAARQGLLQFGAAMLGGRGNFGQVLGGGLAAGAGGYNSALQQLQQKALMDAQTQHLGLENQAAQAAIAKPGKIAGILGQGPAATSASTGVSASLITGAPADPNAPSSAPQASPDPNAAWPLSAFPQSQALARTQLPMLDAASQSQADAPDSSPAPQSSAPGLPSASPVAGLPQLGATSPAAPAQQTTQAQQADLFGKYMGMGDKLAAAGYAADAKPYYDLAQKLRPEVQEVKTALDASGNPVQVITFKDGSQKTSAYGALPDNQVVDLGGSQVLVDKNTGKQAASYAKSQSPDSIASNATTRRGQDLTHSDATAGDQAPITDAAILNAAARYNLDGTLPPMGMGKNAAAGRSAILNKAAELAAGVDPTQQRKDQLGNKGAATAQNTAVREFSTGKLGNSVRSFNVLQSHLDTMGNMADALNNGDTQMFNKLSNALASQTGGTAPTNFEAVKHIVGDEIVKAVTGSAGALGDREAAAKTIASANSPAQLRGVIDTYKELARGQLSGLRQQYEASTGRSDFDKFLSPSSKAASVAPVSSLPKKAGPPPDIATLLNKYGAK